jgi:hypothetical protein
MIRTPSLRCTGRTFAQHQVFAKSKRGFLKNSFLLTKWYLDCVAESGDAVILYVANLRWNALTVQYGSVLTVLDGRVDSSSSLRGGAMPAVEDGMIVVDLPQLDIEGTWQELRSPIQRTIFESAHGSVKWHCLQPMSQVDLLFRGTTRLSGRGYAECLTVSVLPWKLPMHELHWGRFLADSDAVVWIDWRGPHQQRIVFHNGEERPVKSVTESEIVFADSDVRLELDHGLVLRQGRLGDTVFPGISRIAQLLPRSMLSVNECKWLSRGFMHSSGGGSSGYAIHEVVKWTE